MGPWGLLGRCGSPWDSQDKRGVAWLSRRAEGERVCVGGGDGGGDASLRERISLLLCPEDPTSPPPLPLQHCSATTCPPHPPRMHCTRGGRQPHDQGGGDELSGTLTPHPGI